ncbi:hypothetical protein HBI25_218770 [Parastagonospora nodorum]|nr:hypothetical protein HBH51_211440 [Parastagonospora nodorum]KAH4015896.1 hypothetical protein HBI09_203270 [Parastagonospora nodorum]KAH4043577.1 hypothetical protein HBH49_232180 [Parastagonospora nodorum]KAH4089160.1 hypothetical protein HBH46_192990 [Parastagonospora nodorum]KAH4218827.1 hypothetical protein HBI06_194190 [Parastagonospora nodorum]
MDWIKECVANGISQRRTETNVMVAEDEAEVGLSGNGSTSYTEVQIRLSRTACRAQVQSRFGRRLVCPDSQALSSARVPSGASAALKGLVVILVINMYCF